MSVYLAAMLIAAAPEAAEPTSAPAISSEQDTVPAEPKSIEAQIERHRQIRAAIDGNRLTQAELMLGRAVPQDPQEALLYADLRMAQRRFAEALPIYQRLQAELASDFRAWRGAGIALLHLGRAVEAEAPLRKATALEAGDWRSWNALGVAFDKQAKWARSTEAFERALALAPREPAVLNNRAYSLMLQERPGEAAQLLAKARGSADDRRIAMNLALALAMAGSEPEGRAKEESPAQWASRLNAAGYGAWLAGDLPRARSLFAQAIVASDTRYEAAERNLERVEAALRR